MIWLSRNLEFFTVADHPEQWAETVTIHGVPFKRLTPDMWAALCARQNMAGTELERAYNANRPANA